MGVEGLDPNCPYVCPTCQKSHKAKPETGLNICVSGSQMHEFHYPRDNNVTVAPDNIHIDWLTIPGATVDELCDAWRLDYHKESQPMRIMLASGLNDLLRGGDKTSFIEAVKGFKINIDAQNKYHSNGLKNEFCVAPVMNPPKLCWFPDNGQEPPNYENRLVEIAEMNDWINNFNRANGMSGPPCFQTWGTRSSMKVLEDGSAWPFKTHRWNEWRETEKSEKLHLNDKMRGKMGQAIVKYFQSENDRKGILGKF